MYTQMQGARSCHMKILKIHNMKFSHELIGGEKRQLERQKKNSILLSNHAFHLIPHCNIKD